MQKPKVSIEFTNLDDLDFVIDAINEAYEYHPPDRLMDVLRIAWRDLYDQIEAYKIPTGFKRCSMCDHLNNEGNSNCSKCTYNKRFIYPSDLSFD